MTKQLVDVMKTFGPIPADIDPATRPDLQIGPITDFATLQKVIDTRAKVAGAKREEPVDVFRSVDVFTD
jgi:hypothetical protein